MQRMHRALILFAVMTLAVLSACGSTTGGVRTISPDQAVADLGSRTVIDVRTPAEVAEGTIAGAKNIDFQAADFRSRISELDRSGKYLLFCRTGNRSAQAAAVMENLGFTDVVDAGGFDALVAAGAPTAP